MKFRFIYWVGSIITDCYIYADTLQDAIKKFEELKGKDKEVLKIEEVV